MFSELFDDFNLLEPIAEMFHGERKALRVATGNVPYDAVTYLEHYGVKCWPSTNIHVDKETGITEFDVLVNVSQYRYAAGLIAGNNGFALLHPMNVKPIKPKRSWGRPNKTGRGPLASFLRMLT